MGKKKGARPRVFNDNLDPIRADQVDLVWEDPTYQEREDTPLVLKRSDTPGSNSERNVKGEGLKGEPLGWGDDENLSSLVSNSLLWELSELIENAIRAVFGRPPERRQAPQAHRCRMAPVPSGGFHLRLVTVNEQEPEHHQPQLEVPHRTEKMEHAQKSRPTSVARPSQPETVRRPAHP